MRISLKKIPFFFPDKKVLVENFLSLSLLQAANYILPLVTLPYLVRVLGPAKYGLVVFVQALIEYFAIFVDYGFNFSATRKISVSRNDKSEISRIFNTVLFVRIVFMSIAFFIMAIIIFAIPMLRTYWFLYLFAFGILIGRAIFPVWFFQGMERMKYITFLNILAKFIFTVAIFVFVRNEVDYPYVLILNSLGYLTAGILSLWLIWKNFGIEFKRPRIKDAFDLIKKGWSVFISVTTASIYTTAIPLILGILTNYRVVGYYSAGEKIIRALEQMLMPVSQAIYPHISKMASDSIAMTMNFIKKLVILTGALTFILSLSIMFFARPIVEIVLGTQFQGTVSVIRILSLLIFVKGVGHIFLIQTMLNFGDDQVVFKIVFSAAVACILSSFVLMPVFLEKGAAVSALLPEVIMLFSSLIFVEKKFGLLKTHI